MQSIIFAYEKTTKLFFFHFMPVFISNPFFPFPTGNRHYSIVYMFPASCPGGCLPNSVCVRPGLCQCKKGFTGKKCTRRDKSGDKYCRSACLHGGRCKAGICKCPKSRRGEFCQFGKFVLPGPIIYGKQARLDVTSSLAGCDHAQSYIEKKGSGVAWIQLI